MSLKLDYYRPHLSTRQYACILDAWVVEIGLDPFDYLTDGHLTAQMPTPVTPNISCHDDSLAQFVSRLVLFRESKLNAYFYAR